MRNLLIIGMLLVGAFMAGWFQINREGDRTTIEINRNEIRSDTRKAIDRGRDFLDRRDQQYATPSQPAYDDQGRAYWPEQIAAQQEQWGNVQQQSYNQETYSQPQYGRADYRDPGYGSSTYGNPNYGNSSYDAQGQPLPSTQQPYYPPVNR